MPEGSRGPGMKARKRMGRIARRIILVVVIGVPVAIVLCFVASMLICARFFDTDATGARVRLLYETDHQALLDACQELSKRVAAGELKPGEYDWIGKRPPREALTFPQTILDLKPRLVIVRDRGEVTILMVGHPDYVGVRTWGPEKDSLYAGKKLLDGLWYCDLGYVRHPQDWDDRLEKLRPKAKQP